MLHVTATRANAREGEDVAHAIDDVVHEVRQLVGVDLSEYRTQTVRRRIDNRIASVGASTHRDYLTRLRGSHAEALALLERVSIKVSRFYRNADTFDVLRNQLLPALAADTQRPLRIWSAGCGRGEEAWTLAMLLDEQRIDGTVFATDLDREALRHARTAIYASDSAAELPEQLQSRYLESDTSSNLVRVSKELRTRATFADHDLLSGSTPHAGGSFDLICCRNVLIYFQRPAQERALMLLRESLQSDSILCLGEAEWPCGPAMNGLRVISPRLRLFLKAPPCKDDSECAD